MAIRKAADGRVWDAFIRVCRAAEVAKATSRWYVVHLERYLKAHAGRPLGWHEAVHVASYLEKAGRQADLPGWKFKQLVHALQLFFTGVVRSAWAHTYDWDYWLASGRELERTHPTIARHNDPIRTAPPGQAVNAGDFDVSEVARDLAAEIRLRNYSIRTEHAYVSWLKRYVAYHGKRSLAP